MRTQRSAVRLANLLILLLVCLLSEERANANPVYPDQQSISNGAQLYELYCSACHGSDTSSAYSHTNEPNASAADARTNPPGLAQHKETTIESTDVPVPPKKTPWPEWAERPDPNADAPPDPKMETVTEFNALIDKAHGIASGPDSDKEADDVPGNPSAKFEPIPGATNLADPTTYFYGTSEQEMFRSIADGTSTNMAGWRDELGSENAIWDVINYLRSFWGVEWQN